MHARAYLPSAIETGKAGGSGDGGANEDEESAGVGERGGVDNVHDSVVWRPGVSGPARNRILDGLCAFSFTFAHSRASHAHPDTE